MKILIVDDEPNILDILEAYLSQSNYQVFRALNGIEAMHHFDLVQPNLIVLDLMLPDISGMDICKRIRETSDVPIIMLTAKTTETDILKGLQTGADDYITKPFSPKELVARVETVLRRTGSLPTKETEWSFDGGALVIYPNSKRVLKNRQEVILTPTEFEELDVLDRIIDSHIKNLRQKIEDDTKKPTLILTVYGMGYRFGGKKNEPYY